MENKININGKDIQFKLIRSKIKNLYIQIKEGELIIKSPFFMKENQIHKAIREKSNWIEKHLAKSVKKESEKIDTSNISEKNIEIFKEKLNVYIKKYSEILNVNPNKVTIKDMKSAWGSCSSNRNISINIRLAVLEDNLLEYVVIHELCHLKYMNHSKQYWKLVENIMPDYKINRKKLKEK